MTDPFDTAAHPGEIPRDRWGRPLIIPPGGGKPVAYTRCTTYVGALEDRFNLSQWEQRMVAVGLSRRPDLVLAAGAHRDDRDELNRICGQAREAAQANAAREIGTALHKLTERNDRGEDVGTVPADFQADLEAYRRVTAEFEFEHIEQLLVQDELKVAGTPDRLARWRGELVVFDLKTGSVDYAMNKIAMQLALYAHSSLYDPESGARTEPGINQAEAIVCHLPAGQGTCVLYSVDIRAGWEGVQLARQVRAFRAVRSLARPLQVAETPSLDELIAKAGTPEELLALWKAHRNDGWTGSHTAAAARRKAELLDSVTPERTLS